MDSVTNSRSPPKSDKSFWILLVSVVIIVIILIVVMVKCNKPCKSCKECNGTCIEEKPCNLDKDCTYDGERCVGPKNQNFTPPGNCMLSKEKCQNDSNCLPNMYCADPQKLPNPITFGSTGVCYPKKLCKHEVSNPTDPCIDSNVPAGWECDVGYVLHSISPTTSTAGVGNGNWTLNGNANSVPATGNYSIDANKQVTFSFTPSTASPSGKGAGFFHNDIPTTGLPKGFTMKATAPGTAPSFTTAYPKFTLLKPLEGARGYCGPAGPSIGPAPLNSQSHTLRGASHSGY